MASLLYSLLLFFLSLSLPQEWGERRGAGVGRRQERKREWDQKISKVKKKRPKLAHLLLMLESPPRDLVGLRRLTSGAPVPT